MATIPGRIVSYALALFPDGSMAEAAADATGNAYARWLASGTWSTWFYVGRGSLVSVTAAVVSSADVAYVGLVTSGPGGTREIYELTASGLSATSL